MKKLPRGLKKYIRKEKARIQREVFDIKKRTELLEELYKRFFEDKNKTKVK